MILSCNSSIVFARDTDAPDAALLEFLGEGIKVGNEVVDPMSMQTKQAVAARKKQKTQDDRQTADKSGKADGQHTHE